MEEEKINNTNEFENKGVFYKDYETNVLLDNKMICKTIATISNSYPLKKLSYSVCDYDDDYITYFDADSIEILYKELCSHSIFDVEGVFSISKNIDDSNRFTVIFTPGSKKFTAILNKSTKKDDISDVENSFKRYL